MNPFEGNAIQAEETVFPALRMTLRGESNEEPLVVERDQQMKS